ncbi:MAG: hemin uptake protein HemP [Gemmataceae bacterium]
MSESREKSEEPDSPDPRSDESAPVIPARELFGDGREVWIEHNGERYRLRITRRGKLILQK